MSFEGDIDLLGLNPRQRRLLDVLAVAREASTPEVARRVNIPLRSAWASLTVLENYGLVRGLRREDRPTYWRLR